MPSDEPTVQPTKEGSCSLGCIEDNTDYQGNDLIMGGLTSDGPKTCCEKCQATAGCKYWSQAKVPTCICAVTLDRQCTTCSHVYMHPMCGGRGRHGKACMRQPKRIPACFNCEHVCTAWTWQDKNICWVKKNAFGHQNQSNRHGPQTKLAMEAVQPTVD